jgi:hypothetical protein
MANNRFNMQVTPKGYKAGGQVKNSKGTSTSTKGNIRHGKLKSQKELKTITDSKKYKDANYGDKTKMLNVATMKKGGEVKSMYKPYSRKDLLEGAKKAKERNKKQDARKKEINEAAKKFKVGGGGKYKYGPHKVDVNRRATEGLFGRGKIQEKIIKFADKFDKKQEEKRKNKKAMGGRIRKMGGGSLKSVPAGNKGLKKLPTEVRNKMGFMKKGGKVNGK